MDMNVKTLGILGAGQLGRMLAIAAAARGIKAHIFAPDAKGSPAAEIAHSFTQADYDDETALAEFASQIDAVTSEFENVPASTMRFLAGHVPASPGHKALHIAQNSILHALLVLLPRNSGQSPLPKRLSPPCQSLTVRPS